MDDETGEDIDYDDNEVQDDSGPTDDDLVDRILNDDDYDDGTYTDEEREALESDETEGEDDGTEEEGEEGEKEEEEDDELEHILDLREEQEQREEEDVPDQFEVTDEQIANAVFLSDSYKDWMDAADQDGQRVDEAFAAMVGRNRIPQETLVENGIYSMKDMYAHMEGLRENQDPERLVVPDQEAEPEQWADFMEEGFNIPKDADGYDDEEIFADTYFLDEEFDDIRQEKKEWFAEHNFSREQAHAHVTESHQERENYIDSKIQEDKDYVDEQRNLLRREYGADFKAVMKDFYAFRDKYMPEFGKEYENDRVMRSAAFIRGVIRALNDTASPESLRLVTKGDEIRHLTPAGLNNVRSGLEKLVKDREKWSDSSDKGLRRKYNSAKIRLNKVNDEIRKRGLVEV